MGKFAKNKYTTAKGERKINCYLVSIPKKIVDEAKLADKELKITLKDNKIIIEGA